MTDEELTAAINGRKKQIRAMAQRWAGGLVPVEDLIGVIKLAFVQAARGDPPVSKWAGTVPFEAYAMTVARWKLIEYMQTEAANGVKVPGLRDNEIEVVEHESIEHLEGDAYEQLVAKPEKPRPEFPSDFWGRIENTIAPRQWQCLSRQFVQGMSHSEIAHELGITRQAVNRLVARGLDRLQSKMPELSKYLPDGREP
jgi:RNA polymerase sigma factor (sigma-70 family)